MSKLEELFEESPYIGDVTEIDYNSLNILSNDYNISQAYYLPKGSFVLVKVEALNTKDMEEINTVAAILCRVQDILYVSPEVKEPLKELAVKNSKLGATKRELDKIALEKYSQRKLAFFRLNCKILGTFATNKKGELTFGTDAYFLAVSNMYSVFKPINSSLEQIVNFTKGGNFRNLTTQLLASLSRRKNIELEPFRIGYVRYASSVIESSLSVYADQSNNNYIELDKSSVDIYPSDFLRQRTGIFGMTGMGKSNTVKVIANSVMKMANNIGVKVGQLIYDINGEYSRYLENDGKNPNKNLSNENTYCIDHGMLEGNESAYKPALNNFYLDVNYGLSIMQQGIKESGQAANILNNFFEIKDIEKNILTHIFWIFFLYKSGCALPTIISKNKFDSFVFQCQVDQEGYHQGFSWVFGKEIFAELNKIPDLRKYLSAKASGNYLALNSKTIKELLNNIENFRTQTYNTDLEHVDQKTLTSFILQSDLNTRGSVIAGWQMVAQYSYLHCDYTAKDYKETIYNSLLKGETVFLNLSIGKHFARKYIADELMHYIMERQIQKYRKEEICPLVNIFIEEAQNVLGHISQNTLWSRVCIEGFKYNIGFIYATQEPSAIHTSILANTNNFIVAHLNNEKEIKVLSEFEDLGDFSQLTRTSEDIGFVRIRLLSKSYTVPVQMDRY